MLVMTNVIRIYDYKNVVILYGHLGQLLSDFYLLLFCRGILFIASVILNM